jgi:NitT/TauT family transport system permease protein
MPGTTGRHDPDEFAEFAAAAGAVAIAAPVDEDEVLASEIAGLDALEQALLPAASRLVRAWKALWPKLAAVALVLVIWQLVVWSRWKPDYVLPGPTDVLPRVWHELGVGTTWVAIGSSMRRAVLGFVLSVIIGLVLGIAVARFTLLRTAVGSMISGLQTMPSVVWYPLAVVLFRLSEGAIFFVVIIGAAPSIANGVIGGIDHIPPLLKRAGRVLGARGLASYRHIILPAALPAFVGGLKQGWAFAWRSLMAGELIGGIAVISIGAKLNNQRDFNDYSGLLAWMIIVLVIGIVVDALVFGAFERRLRHRRGLIPS